MKRSLVTVLLAAFSFGTPAVAMSPELTASVDAAIERMAPPLAFATRLALLDARLAGPGIETNDLAEAATYSGTIVPPTRYARDLAGLSAALAASSPEAASAIRAEIERLQATAFQPGIDPTLNRLRAIELLLQIASSLYAEAVALDGTALSPRDVRWARGIVTVVGEIHASIERDLDGRVQSIAAGMKNVLGMIDREVSRDPVVGLAKPEAISGLISFFLGYSANF